MQPTESGTETRIAVEAGRSTGRSRRFDRGVIGAAVANALEASVAGLDVRFQYSVDPIAQQAVGVPDDSGAGTQRAVVAFAITRRGSNELGLADRSHLHRAVLAVFGSTLDEHRR